MASSSILGDAPGTHRYLTIVEVGERPDWMIAWGVLALLCALGTQL